MKGKISIFIFSFVSLLLPLFVLAQVNFGPPPPIDPHQDVNFLLVIIDQLLNFLWIIFFAFAIITILLSGFMFLGARGDPEGTKRAQRAFLWGVIGFAAGASAALIVFVIRWLIFPF